VSLFLSLAASALGLLLAPAELLAWGPGTHIALGQGVLASLHLLPPAIRTILDRNRISFLYGSVAADISFAKKYAKVGRHSHHWHVGEEILATADSEALQAVGYGYLAHLAADTIAHNLFVPRKILLTGTSLGVSHPYWEHRMDVHLGKHFGGEARRIVLTHDHREADLLFDRVVSHTIFSFRTNQKIFRGMIAAQDDQRWQRVFEELLRRSRHDLPEDRRDRYIQLSFELVMDYLANGRGGMAARLDPVGEAALREAAGLRREMPPPPRARSAEGEAEWQRLVDLAFPMFETPLLYLPRTTTLPIPGLCRVIPEVSGPGASPPPEDPPSLGSAS